ncbi:MAG TPA: hypothetical protein VHD38_00035 [Candidatus Paceibacterota bacterium]|nr:hypothetical protein [Candidatus Paceibacterota bacterium]
MPNILREVRELREEGKLHQNLIRRTRTFLIISLILFCVAVYLAFVQAVQPVLWLAVIAVGLAAGFFIFSRITPVQWNEETEQIEGASMGYLGYGMIGLYILFEIGARTLLGDIVGETYQAYLFALIFGVIFGRTFGVVFEMHRVYRREHPLA